MKKKKLDPLDIYKGIRKTWRINPKTRVVPNKKKKTRQQEKVDLKKETTNGS